MLADGLTANFEPLLNGSKLPVVRFTQAQNPIIFIDQLLNNLFGLTNEFNYSNLVIPKSYNHNEGSNKTWSLKENDLFSKHRASLSPNFLAAEFGNWPKWLSITPLDINLIII